MPGFQPKIGGLSAALADEKKKQQEALVAQQKAKGEVKPFEYVSPKDVKDRLRILFDDSGSMSGQKIIDAREGTVELMRNCVVNQTAVAVHPLNYGRSRYGYKPEKETDLTALTTNMPAMSILVKEIEVSGSTPLFTVMQEAIAKEPKATRYIVFSDGCPDDSNLMDSVVTKLKETETKCDTVLITDYEQDETSRAYQLMKELAEKTGGLFLVFDRTKVNFKTAFKYLSPGLRLQLAASVSMQQNLQAGKLK